MSDSRQSYNQRQLAFQEFVIGTLIYTLVLGLFNDYTSIVYAKSFSTIFFASIVLEILTYIAFQLKRKVIKWLGRHDGTIYKFLKFLGVWLIMFLSKFVFILALDLVFGTYIRVNGFFGILLVVLCVTLIHRLAYLIFRQLGDT